MAQTEKIDETFTIHKTGDGEEPDRASDPRPGCPAPLR